ncbi:unnamed protein product [Staurois parvus]|uniref:Uncharacterized protein n=1 Tax=Staurois parvus TaxID=386267 RepID=A0ABN9AWK8_9NEOB|nr:unnamed protein product [Staurois parvus]
MLMRTICPLIMECFVHQSRSLWFPTTARGGLTIWKLRHCSRARGQ